MSQRGIYSVVPMCANMGTRHRGTPVEEATATLKSDSMKPRVNCIYSTHIP